MDEQLVNLLIRMPVVLLALTVHEFSHAYFAYRMGDPTALRMGRCTLNPLKHLDPLGTICLMFAWIGWAKPVPINPLNFRDFRKGVLVSTAAGPASNLVQAIIWAIVMRGVWMWKDHLAQTTPELPEIWYTAYAFCFLGVVINTALMVFNLLPIYPLDGFHITLQLQRPESQQRFAETARYGPFMILGIILIGHLGHVPILMTLIKPPATLLLLHVAGMPADEVYRILP